MQSRRTAVALVVVGAAIGAALLVAVRADAGLEGDVFTSREANIRMVAPRDWRVSDLPSYPGVLLWMVRTKPRGLMLLTVETIDRHARCAWPASCRSAGRPLAEQMACALGARLATSGFQVGPVQSGRTPWFDYEDGRRWLRQAVLVSGATAVTLILSTDAATDRATHVRTFDRALRSLRPMTASEAAAAAPVVPLDAGVDAPPTDATVGDAGALPPTPMTDGGVEPPPVPSSETIIAAARAAAALDLPCPVAPVTK